LPSQPEDFERIRRFYKTVGVAPAGQGYAVTLDQRTPRSPGGHRLVLPTDALASLVAEEWAAQRDFIVLVEMSATRLAYSALDGVAAARAETAASVARYAGADLLCYFADGPRALVERQETLWTPLLAWAGSELELPLVRATGVVHTAQPPQSLARAEALAAGLDDFALAGLAFATALFGSAVLGFALQRGRLSADQAFALSRLDETFQEEQWGLDAEAAARADALAADALMLERWFRALA
jgi:chaperone required for assembly of F1-ATPase